MKNEGFSLVEVMVVLFITSICLSGAYSVMVNNKVERKGVFITCREGLLYKQLGKKIWKTTGEKCFVEEDEDYNKE